MDYIEINGTVISYESLGTGNPVIFVHGSASDYRSWKSQKHTFAKYFRCIFYSRRYHWPNKPIPEGIDYSMNQQIDDLESLILSLKAEPAHLVGHSYGAFICLLLAMRKPRLVRTMVIAEPPITSLYLSKNPSPLELLKLFISKPGLAAEILKFGMKGIKPAAQAFREGKSDIAIRIFGNAVFGYNGYERFTLSRKKQVIQNLSNVKAELTGSGFIEPEMESLRHLHIPTLLVSGEHSIKLFHLLMDDLATVLPDSINIEIPVANHMMHEDNPEFYNNEIIRFLSGHQY